MIQKPSRADFVIATFVRTLSREKYVKSKYRIELELELVAFRVLVCVMVYKRYHGDQTSMLSQR